MHRPNDRVRDTLSGTKIRFGLETDGLAIVPTSTLSCPSRPSRPGPGGLESAADVGSGETGRTLHLSLAHWPPAHVGCTPKQITNPVCLAAPRPGLLQGRDPLRRRIGSCSQAPTGSHPHLHDRSTASLPNLGRSQCVSQCSRFSASHVGVNGRHDRAVLGVAEERRSKIFIICRARN